jgi:hypothetical protein
MRNRCLEVGAAQLRRAEQANAERLTNVGRRLVLGTPPGEARVCALLPVADEG